MTKPLAVGDRVVCYGFSYAGQFCKKTSGEVKSVCSTSADVLLDGRISEDTFHVKQLRRIVSKKRRRVWVEYIPGQMGPIINKINTFPFEDAIEFVEVKKK